MPGFALTYLSKPLAILAVAAALFGYRELLIHQRDAARAQAAALNARQEACAAGAQAWRIAIADQNAAIARLRRDQAQTAAAARTRETAAAARAETGFNRGCDRAKTIKNASVN
jgi:hypothetical protein